MYFYTVASLTSIPSLRLSPIGPDPGQDDPKSSIPVGQAAPFGIPLDDFELMAKREVLQGQRAVGLQGREERSEKKRISRGK